MKASYPLNYILAIILLLSCKLLVAQKLVTLSGTILDEAGNPLVGAIIGHTSKTATTSNTKGYYQLLLPQNDSIQLRITYIGYQTENVTLFLGQNTERSFKLKLSPSALNQVIVSAGKYGQEIKRVTVSTDIIKPYLIENKAVLNIEHIMNQVPGVNIVDGQANIRGGSGWTYGAGTRVMVMLDELPFITGDANQVQWKFLPTENIEQMEVIKGASSVLYGSSALNGIINIRTAKPNATPKTSFTLIGGMYDQLKRDSTRWSPNTRFQRGFSAFDSRKIKQLDLTLSTNYVKDDGYRLGERDERLRISTLTNYHSTKIAGLSYGINASLMRTNAQSFLLWENWQYAYTATDSQTTDSRSTNFSIDPHADFTVWGIKNRFRSRILRTINDITTADTSVNQDNQSWMVYTEYQLQKQLPKQFGNITAGIARTWVQSNAALYQGKHNTLNLAPYMQADLRWKRLSASLGARFEQFEIDGKKESKTIYRAGMSFEATSSTFIRSSFGQGYRFPSIAERYISTTAGIIQVFPNPNLQSETGWNAELGIRQGVKLGGWSGLVDIAYFHTEYQNMVEFNFAQWAPLNFTNPFQSFGFKSVNIGDARISGIDGSITGSGKIKEVLIRSILGYTYMNPVSLTPTQTFIIDSSGSGNEYNYRNTSSDTSNDVLKYRYRHLAKADIEFMYKKWSLGYSLRYNSYMQNIDKVFNTLVPGLSQGRALNPNGDWLMDMRIAFQLNAQFKFSILINNITNREQMTRPADMRPPRLFLLQICYAL